MEAAGGVAVVYGASKTDKGDPINQPSYSIITTNYQKISTDTTPEYMAVSKVMKFRILQIWSSVNVL